MSFTINVYDSSLQVPEYVVIAMRNKESAANCILPILLKSRVYESHNQVPPRKQVWLVCSSKNSAGGAVVELVLSVTEGYIDSYPIFFFSSLPSHLLTQEFVQPRMERTVKILSGAVPSASARVYAVYGPDPLAYAFAWNWTNVNGVQNYGDRPYYAAKLSSCTRQTLKYRSLPLPGDLIPEIRPANNNDIPELAQGCFGFAADSDPYFLTHEGAMREAEFLVRHNQVWIHRLTRQGSTHSEVASIVAYSRNSDTNATITKVFTNPNWRRLGCAERLVRHVTQFLLQTKATVSLFVAHDNPSATKVYNRVGFAGLDPKEGAVAESWTEIGFDRRVVRLGHW